jgi:hypothetical protein
MADSMKSKNIFFDAQRFLENESGNCHSSGVQGKSKLVGMAWI